MFQFTANEMVQISNTINTLTALHEANDERLFTDEPFRADVIEIPRPPLGVMNACHVVAVVLQRHDISAPALVDFVADPSPFVVDRVAAELRKLQNESVQ